MINLLPGIAESHIASLEENNVVLGAYIKDLEGFYRFVPAFVSMDEPMLKGLLDKLIELNNDGTSTRH